MRWAHRTAAVDFKVAVVATAAPVVCRAGCEKSIADNRPSEASRVMLERAVSDR